MTQALINNLNNLKQDCGLSQTDNSLKAEPIDFAKILEKKTDKSESQNTNNNDNNDNNTTLFTLKDVKSNTDINNQEALKKELDNTVKEIFTEAVVDLTISEDVLINDIETEENTEENIETITDTDTTTDITNEEPTMNEDLTTLTNPAVAILIHSNQILGVTKSVDTNQDNNELTENNNILDTKTTKSDLNNNTGVFKQFENTISKETPNIPDKVIPDTKNEKTPLDKFITKEMANELNLEVLSQTASEEGQTGADIMQNQTPQEQAAKVMIQGDLKYEEVSSNEAVKTAQVKTSEITPSKIIEQISKQLENLHNNSKLSLILNPGALGKVNIQIVNGKDGLTAQFTVTTQEARDILMKGLDGLKESLLAQGINIDDVSVKFEEADNEYQGDWTEQEGSRGGNKQQEAKKQKENEKTFEEIIRDSVEASKES